MNFHINIDPYLCTGTILRALDTTGCNLTEQDLQTILGMKKPMSTQWVKSEFSLSSPAPKKISYSHIGTQKILTAEQKFTYQQ